MRIGILTVSDKGSRGEREDKSGKAIEELVGPALSPHAIEYAIVADEEHLISAKLIELADAKDCRLILTTGGTGLGVRDVTPEATSQVMDRPVPGFPETMRAASLAHTPRGMLSRATAGMRGNSLIVNLPGSPKAVRECLAAILPALPHAIEILEKGSMECGEEETKK